MWVILEHAKLFLATVQFACIAGNEYIKKILT